ncbi:acylphosphatase [Patescibacteria group bacterium]|nr:acylphosphatase [Patescibacteria group bacterium]MBU2633458.1 acylphosphatase [Patescibacteria group bacterium]
MKKRIVLKIYGRVQGVFFRDSTKRKAEELDLLGWVRNEAGGAVQIVAEGEEENLKKLVEWCRDGGLEYAKIDNIDIEWQKPSNQFNSFVVK